jgi:glutathione reductase (NADPH)
MHKPYDLLIIGAGSGGLSAAMHAAKLGARVGICEKTALGGTCVNRGCVPKKLFFYASEYGQTFQEAKKFGWNVQADRLAWPRLLKHKNTVIQTLRASYENLLKKHKITLFKSSASFIDKHTLKVNRQTLKASKILIATGASPFLPELYQKPFVFTSDDMFQLKSLPSKIVIVGGGYIAMEFAGMLHRLGVKVTVIEWKNTYYTGHTLCDRTQT